MAGKRVHVGESNRRILSGEGDDIIDWDDEELWRGRRRDKDGTWRGRPPTLVPLKVHQEMARRKFDQAGEVLRESVVEAVQYWADVLRDPDAPDDLRMRSSENIVKYTLGKPIDRAQVELSVSRKPWEEAIIAALVPTDGEVIDAEVIREDPEGIEWDE